MKRFKINNPVYKDLLKLKLINKQDLILFNNKTRDSNIKSLKDKKSGIIFLEKYKRNLEYYNKKKTNRIKIKNQSFSNFNVKKQNIKTSNLNDDYRRYVQFKKLLKNKIILDYGCGKGGFLKYCKSNAKKVHGVEVNKYQKNLLAKNFIIEDSINKFNNNKFDIITCFHVIEHLPNQIEIISELLNKLKKKGKLILEVPSAHDFLLASDKLIEFKNFTMWSEHLILHTKQSLRKFIDIAGGKKNKIYFYQRYDLSNHFGWFIDRKPGGHDQHLLPSKLNNEYKNYLIKIKKTDTLIAIIEK